MTCYSVSGKQKKTKVSLNFSTDYTLQEKGFHRDLNFAILRMANYALFQPRLFLDFYESFNVS